MTESFSSEVRPSFSMMFLVHVLCVKAAEVADSKKEFRKFKIDVF